MPSLSNASAHADRANPTGIISTDSAYADFASPTGITSTDSAYADCASPTGITSTDSAYADCASPTGVTSTDSAHGCGSEPGWSAASAAAITLAMGQGGGGQHCAQGAHFRLVSERLKWLSGGGASYPAFARAIQGYAESMRASTLLADELAAPMATAHQGAP